MSQEIISTIKRRQRPEYWCWAAMLQRCRNEKNPQYKHYGGRGIRVCADWIEFDAFFKDMGERPSSNHSIERKNNDGNYEPSNCVWADDFTQNNNRSANVQLTLNGVTMTVAQWSRHLGIARLTIKKRINKGYPIEIVLSSSKIKQPGRPRKVKNV